MTTVVRSVGYWQRDRHRHQWNRKVNSETDLDRYAQLIFNKGSKTILWGKIAFSTIAMEQMNFDLNLRLTLKVIGNGL